MIAVTANSIFVTLSEQHILSEILGNLGHFRHSFVPLYQIVITRHQSKDRFYELELEAKDVKQKVI